MASFAADASKDSSLPLCLIEDSVLTFECNHVIIHLNTNIVAMLKHPISNIVASIESSRHKATIVIAARDIK